MTRIDEVALKFCKEFMEWDNAIAQDNGAGQPHKKRGGMRELLYTLRARLISALAGKDGWIINADIAGVTVRDGQEMNMINSFFKLIEDPNEAA